MAVDPLHAVDDPLTRVVGAQTHALFEQHARMVYGLCRALLRDPDDADDATQATFISAYRSLLGGSEVREPAAWLATIARNECAARARARMREPLPLLEADLGHAPGPEFELDRKAFVDELQQAIAGLPEKQREAVVLRDLYGLQYTEVGAALGMSVASVESLLFRARRSLRISLKPLASGALTVPIAVREGIAQALPAFTTTRAAGSGAASGAIGLGLLAKLAGGPAAVKTAAGVAAVVAAGSIAVVGVERAEQQRPSHVEQATQSHAVGAKSDPRLIHTAADASVIASPTVAVAAGRQSGGGSDDGNASARAGGDGNEGSDDPGPTVGGRSEHEGSAGAHSSSDDGAGASARRGKSDHSENPGNSDHPGDGGDPDDSGSHQEIMSAETSHSGSSHQGEGGGDSESGRSSDERQDPAESEGSEGPGGSGEDEHDSDGSEQGDSGHGPDDGSDDGSDDPPA